MNTNMETNSKLINQRIQEAQDKRVKRLAKAREKYARDKANKNGVWALKEKYKLWNKGKGYLPAKNHQYEHPKKKTLWLDGVGRVPNPNYIKPKRGRKPISKPESPKPKPKSKYFGGNT